MALAHVILGTGRSIELSTLRMEETYAGLLEGYPTRRMNDARVASVLKRAEQDYPALPVYLVEPAREPGELQRTPFGPMESLPGVMCTGFFTSNPVDPELDTILHFSRLVVVWFQEASDLSSAAQVIPELSDLPWDEKAEDCEL